MVENKQPTIQPIAPAIVRPLTWPRWYYNGRHTRGSKRTIKPNACHSIFSKQFTQLFSIAVLTVICVLLSYSVLFSLAGIWFSFNFSSLFFYFFFFFCFCNKYRIIFVLFHLFEHLVCACEF